jgi:hypothetical protein
MCPIRKWTLETCHVGTKVLSAEETPSPSFKQLIPVCAKQSWARVLAAPVIPAPWRVRQEDHELQASLGSTETLCQNKKHSKISSLGDFHIFLIYFLIFQQWKAPCVTYIKEIKGKTTQWWGEVVDLGTVACICHSSTWKAGELLDPEIKASLGDVARPHLKIIIIIIRG